MGKAGFAHLQGSGKRIQVYVKKDVVGERGLSCFTCWTSVIRLESRPPVSNEDQRAVHLGRRIVFSFESAAAVAGEMARVDRRGASVPAEVSGPDRQ